MTSPIPTNIPGVSKQLVFPQTGADANILRNELFKSGLIKMAQKDIHGAIKAWTKLSKKQPNSFEVWSGLGKAYFQIKNTTEAKRCLKKSLNIHPTNPLDWEYLGMTLTQEAMESKDIDYSMKYIMPETIECFENALKYNPEKHNLKFKIGILYASIGKFDKAQFHVENYLKVKPKDSEAHLALKRIKQQKKEVENARNDSRSQTTSATELLNVKFKSKKTSLLFDNGMNYIRNRNINEAIKSFQETLKQEPNHKVVIEKLGLAYRMGNQPQNAIKSFEKLFELDSTNMLALDNLLDLYAMLNDKENQGRTITRIKNSSSKYNDYMINIGEAFVKDGSMDGGIKYFVKVLLLTPNHEGAIKRISDLTKHPDFKSKVNQNTRNVIQEMLSKSVAFNVKNTAEPIVCNKCFISVTPNLKYCPQCGNDLKVPKGTQSVSLDELSKTRKEQEKKYPGSPIGKKIEKKITIDLYNKAGKLKSQGRYAEAISALNEAIKHEPNVPMLHEQLGICFLLKNDLSTAITHLNKSIELNPYQIMAWEALISIYVKQGNTPKSNEIFQKLLSFGPIYANFLVDTGKQAFENRMTQEAANCWKKALMADPNNKEAQIHLSMVEMTLSMDKELDKFKGDYKRAVEYYRKKLDLDPNDETTARLLRWAEMKSLGIKF